MGTRAATAGVLPTLPDALEGHRAGLEAALNAPVPGEWPEDRQYVDAAQPTAIASTIIEPLHPHLGPASIVHLFKQELTKSSDRVQLGKAKKASALIQALTERDFIILYSWRTWKLLRPLQRIALVDHELCHCGVDAETGKWQIVHHDIEEFGGVVVRWGLWKQDLVAFGHAMQQLDLFGPGHDPQPIKAAIENLRKSIPEGCTMEIQVGDDEVVRLER